MANRRIEEHLEQLTRLRHAQPAEAAAPLRKALADKTNLIVAKAAKIAGDSLIHELIPDLLTAFDRLFGDDPAKRDPQCWGKNAIARALRDTDYAEAAPFLRGARHIQMEPVWGGQQDTAAALRGICLLALPGCNDIRRETIMRYLVDALTEEDPAVRADAARAFGAMGGDDSALVLRLKSRTGDKESAVVGQVFESLLSLERVEGLEFVKQFLSRTGGDTAEEAALAMGSSRMEKAVEILLDIFAGAMGEEYRQAILRALSISRNEKALEFLHQLVKEGRAHDRADAKAALDLFPDSGATRG